MIVITTMNALPDYCYECPCHDNEHGHCNADAGKRYNIEYRPFWCPLKEEGTIDPIKVIEDRRRAYLEKKCAECELEIGERDCVMCKGR